MGVKFSGNWKKGSGIRSRLGKIKDIAAELSAQATKDYLARELPRVPGGKVFGTVVVGRTKEEGRGHRNIEVEVRPETLESLHPQTNVFYIKQGSPAGELVAKYNPYSFDTFPVYTGINNADITYRRVRKSEVMVVSRDRKQIQQELSLQLNRVGVQVRFGASGLKHKVTRDVAFQLGRMEYGIPSEPMNPIMRRLVESDIIDKAIINNDEFWKEFFQ